MNDPYYDENMDWEFGTTDSKSEDTQEFIKGIMEAIYDTGKVERLEGCLEELCALHEVEFKPKDLKVETKGKKMKELVLSETDTMINDIQNTTKMCQILMQSPHYKKMGNEGIFAIVEKAKSIGVSPLDALNGGMYFVQGKVEMTSAMMNQLIRMCNHSITKDKRSDDTICILHGKRADNGDTWVESFSIDDAKKAGIYRNQWLKYPKDMLFARSLSRLARQLFPDVIKGCYVQGEIADAPAFDATVEEIVMETTETAITDEQYQELEGWMGDNLNLRQNILMFMKKKWGLETLQEMPIEIYEQALKRAKEQHCKPEQSYGEETQAMGE